MLETSPKIIVKLTFIKIDGQILVKCRYPFLILVGAP